VFKRNPLVKVKRPVIALTGGIASGKTTAARQFAKLGAEIIDFDKLARVVCAKGTSVLQQFVRKFGKDILTKTGRLNRKKLGKLVYGNQRKRRSLEAIVHPAIMVEVSKKLNTIKCGRVIILDVPLLFETGLDRFAVKTIVVWAREEQQSERLKKRDGLNDREISLRLSSQMPLSIKKKKADFVIDNSGKAAQAGKQVKKVWELLTKDFK